MDIQKLTEIETKASIYDHLSIMEATKGNLKILDEHLKTFNYTGVTPVEAPASLLDDTLPIEKVQQSSESETTAKGINEQSVGQA